MESEQLTNQLATVEPRVREYEKIAAEWRKYGGELHKQKVAAQAAIDTRRQVGTRICLLTSIRFEHQMNIRETVSLGFRRLRYF